MLFLPGLEAAETWAWNSLRRNPDDNAAEVGVASDDMSQEMTRLDAVYDTASDSPSRIAKAKMRGLARSLRRDVPDICRVVAKLEAGRQDSDLQPLVEEMEDTLLQWRAE